MADAENVLVAGDGALNVGPVGSTLPADVLEPLDASLVDMGYLSEDGATFRDEKTREPIMVWQSFYAIKYRTSGANAETELALKEFNARTVPLAFGGGAVTGLGVSPGDNGYEYVPPEPDEIDERAMVLSWWYDSYPFRLVVPRVMVTGATEMQLARTGETDLPLTLSILGATGVVPWRFMTTHPGFALT